MFVLLPCYDIVGRLWLLLHKFFEKIVLVFVQVVLDPVLLRQANQVVPGAHAMRFPG
jgi:hypothetical protein